MHLSEPRIEPVDRDQFQELQLELFGNAPDPSERVLNVTRLWARHPALMKAQRPLQRHVLGDSTLSPRLRELAILRIGWRCQSDYELAQHAAMGMRAGLDLEDLARVTQTADAAGWSAIDSAVIRAVDEMFDDAFVSNTTWQALSNELTEQQLIDLLVVVGRYWSVSVVLNSTGVQLEDDTKPFRDYLPADT